MSLRVSRRELRSRWCPEPGPAVAPWVDVGAWEEPVPGRSTAQSSWFRAQRMKRGQDKRRLKREDGQIGDHRASVFVQRASDDQAVSVG